MKNLFKKAHILTKKIKRDYPTVNYRTQFGICLTYLAKRGVKIMEMVELKGSEKQITWAEKIRKEQLNNLKFYIKEFKEDVERAKFKEKAIEKLEKLENSTEEIKDIDSAKWWIENRNIARHLMEKAMQQIKVW